MNWFNVNNLLIHEDETKCVTFFKLNVKQVKTSVLIN